MTARLTVVVPVYNVEQYLEECLRSIAAQTMGDLDVVMVDDGSTDASAGLARAFAAADPRFRLVSQDNGGLGHARNTGARHADPKTPYLTFVDSDDVLPPRAYEQLTGLLDRSGSDFATGNVYRLTAAGRSQGGQHRGMTRTVSRTHVTRDLSLLSDRVAWNKVFRRDFWDRHALAFPEGVLYEDTPLTIPAHFLADAVDVLKDHVYYWRIREGSITRRRTDVKGVTDRLAAVDGVSRFLGDPARARWNRFKRHYDRSVLTDDLVYFIEVLPMAGPDYRRVFMERCQDFMSRVDPAVWPDLPVELRMRWELVREGRLNDLLDVLAHERHGGRAVFDLAGPPLRKRAAVVRPDGTPVPMSKASTSLGRGDLPVVAQLRDLRWRDGKLLLRGFAYVRNAEVRGRRSALTTAVAVCGRRRLLLPVRTVRAQDVTDALAQERHCYDWSGFEITVDPRRLRTDGAWKPAQWRIGVLLAGPAGVRPAALRAAEAGAGSSPVPFPLDGDTRLVPWYKDGRLHLAVEPVTRRLTGHRPAGEDALRLDLEVRDRTLPVALRLTRQGAPAPLERPLQPVPQRGDAADGWTPLSAELPLADIAAGRPSMAGLPKEVPPETTATWTAEVVFPDGGTARVSLDRDLPPGRYPLPDDTRVPGTGQDGTGSDPAGGPAQGPVGSAQRTPSPEKGADPSHTRARELSVEATAAGNLVVRDRVPHAVAYEVGLTPDGRLLVGGELPAGAADPVRMVLRHGRYGAEIGAGVERGPADRFSASVDVGALPHEGRWYLHLRAAGGGGTPVRIAPRTMPALPMELATAEGERPVTLDRRFHDHLFVAAGSAVPAPDRGPYRQRMLRERRYPVLLRRAFTPTVLYSSFDGLRCDDSPRAVHDEMVRRGEDFAHVWVVADRSVPVPAAARAVVRGSHAWYEALARSRCVVTNTHLPAFFRRREGQHVLQTGLGTPVKRFGQDLAGTLCADLVHMWPQPMRGDQWTVLLSPNAQSTPVLRRALAFTGEVAETGLPRNDLLSGEDRDKIAEDVRARLGLPPDRTVVLYAPTARDDESYDADHHRLRLTADLAELEAALGGTHVLLLRAHPLVADTVRTPDSGFVRDVTRHPDLAELLLAADVLVTDYSSLLADFAVTAKPVLLQTPDLAHMRDTLRGFTFDIEAQAPGPLLSSTAELVDALRDPAAAVRPYGAAYDAFRAAFCHLDDGGAAARVADLILRGPRI